jgi:hypothetical protein
MGGAVNVFPAHVKTNRQNVITLRKRFGGNGTTCILLVLFITGKRKIGGWVISQMSADYLKIESVFVPVSLGIVHNIDVARKPG